MRYVIDNLKAVVANLLVAAIGEVNTWFPSPFPAPHHLNNSQSLFSFEHTSTREQTTWKEIA